MANLISNSVHALAKALLEELASAESNPQHSRICISNCGKDLPNGMKHYTAQIECNAGCGWLIQASDEESEALALNVIALQNMLTGTNYEAQHSLTEIMLTLFPEYILKEKAFVPKDSRGSKLGGL